MIGVGLALVQVAIRQMLGGFNPRSLFSNGEIGALYEPWDLSTLFQDAAGTTPVTTAGQPVGLMLDKSGNGNHATQSTATSRPLYQTSGGLAYLDFDGTDDFLVTSSFAWGSDEAFIAAGVRKDSNAATAVLFETSSSFAGNASSFAVLSPNGSSPNYAAASRGGATSASNQVATASPYAAPITNVLASTNDISGDLTTLRVDGVAATPATGDKGAGNFGTYPLYIGRRGGTTLPFNGRLYGAILRNLNPDAATIAQVEAYLANKSGVTLP